MRHDLTSVFASLCVLVAACGADESSSPTDSGLDSFDTVNDVSGSDVAVPEDGVEVDTAAPDVDVEVDVQVDVEVDVVTDASDATVDPVDARVEDVAADSDGTSDVTPLPTEPTEVEIFANEGGTVDHAGSRLVVPAGATADNIVLTVNAGNAVVEGLEVVGAVYDFGPDGTEFLVPVRVSLPLGGASASTATIWWTDRAGEYQPLPTFVDGGNVYAFVDHFSQGVVVQCGALTCGANTATCTDATTLSVVTNTCQAGACLADTDTLNCARSFPNVVGSGCTAGTCSGGSCATGFTNCDGNLTNGCEVFGACPVCGDGVVQASEGCDDGNNVDGDGCSLDCLVEGCVVGTEVCDGIDNNCNGQVDEGLRVTYYLDADEDGYGNNASTVLSCSALTGYVLTPGDCDDTDLRRSPGVAEVCNDGVDNDCDTVVDNGCSFPVCGDGVIDAAESCDDMNNTDGDGCDSTCLVEAGFACMTEPSVCSTTCGDGVSGGSEECDDGNNNDGDGCSAACLNEP
jgi:cysteine-rich repeat protein